MKKINEIDAVRYESTFTELPLIGKIPKFIRGNILKTKFGDIDLDKESSNFFKKLNWHSRRTFKITEVECIKDTCTGAYPIKKGEICKVTRVNFYYSSMCEHDIHELGIKRISKSFGDVTIWYAANNFIPTKYKILTDETLEDKK